VIYAGNLVLLG